MNRIISVFQRTASPATQRQTSEDWEFALCTEGCGLCRFDGENLPYEKGETVAVPPGVAHSFFSEKGSRTIHIFTDRPTLALKEPLIIQGNHSHWLRNAFEAALYHFEAPGEDKKILLAAYGNLIICYLAAAQKEHRLSRTVETIRREINTRFTDPAFELDSFLETLPFNYDYLRKLFQKETGITPLQYLNNLRLQLAAEALLSAEAENISMADIARLCGFREPLYFSRMFKKQYGVAPSLYLESVTGPEKGA